MVVSHEILHVSNLQLRLLEIRDVGMEAGGNGDVEMHGKTCVVPSQKGC